MCGLIGMCGDLNQSHEKLTRTLLILDSLRGEDSTGIAAIGKYQGGVKVAKQVGDPFQLFDHKSYDKVFTGFQRAIIGHNRYATTGGVSRNNAHPFENDSLVGVHNGTLRNKHVLADSRNYVVDSENLYHHIEKHGLKDALKIIDGAWTLVWWDKKALTINFLRNKERPLYMCWSKDNKVLFWASEEWMLHVALNKHGMDHQDIFELRVDTHYSLPINDQGVIGKGHIADAPGTYEPKVWTAPVAQLPVVAKKEEPAAATPKKLEGETPVPPQCDTSYLSKRVSCIETVNVAKDKDGCDYINCYDPERPYTEIRLYARPKKPIWDLVGCDIAGSISGWSAAGRIPNTGFYKINPDTVTILVPVDEDEFEAVEQVMGPNGRFISKAEFLKEFPTCDFCNTDLVFGDANRFTTGGQCICSSCAKNKDVLPYVNLM